VRAKAETWGVFFGNGGGGASRVGVIVGVDVGEVIVVVGVVDDDVVAARHLRADRRALRPPDAARLPLICVAGASPFPTCQ
jgi:hypothetical protein